MFPVIAMCGHRCGLLMTATTAIWSVEGESQQATGGEGKAEPGEGTCATGCPDGFGAELGQEDVLDFVRDSADDVDEAGDHLGAVLAGDRGLEGVQVDILAVVVRVQEAADDLGADANRNFGLGLLHGGRRRPSKATMARSETV